jgi:hypothetical protein
MIKVPSDDQIQKYKDAVAEKYPLLCDVWSSMDGIKTPIQQSGSTKTQGYFYNGWKHNHFVTSVFCFCPDGTIHRSSSSPRKMTWLVRVLLVRNK